MSITIDLNSRNYTSIWLYLLIIKDRFSCLNWWLILFGWRSFRQNKDFVVPSGWKDFAAWLLTCRRLSQRIIKYYHKQNLLFDTSILHVTLQEKPPKMLIDLRRQSPKHDTTLILIPLRKRMITIKNWNIPQHNSTYL